MKARVCVGFSILLAACGSGGGGSSGDELPVPEKTPVEGETPAGNIEEEAPEPPSVTLFEDVSLAVGLTGLQERGRDLCNPFLGSGAAWGDIDLDGDVDLFATNHGGPNYLYLNQGDTTGDGIPDFMEAAGAFGIQEANRLSHSAVFVDYDNDGDQDLYVTNQDDGNTLWKNDLVESGALAFTDVTALAGVADEGRAVTSSWGDLDQDGHLDFYLAKHARCFLDVNTAPPDRLYHSLADGRFEDWSRYLCQSASSDCRNVTSLGFTAGFLDHDNDGDPDIYLVNDATHGGGPNRHWRNDGSDGQGGWLLQEVSGQLGTNTRLNGMGLAMGDLDNDGWLDLAFSNIEESHVLHNLGGGSFEDITYACGIFAPTRILTGWGTAAFDADNDGYLDLFFANGPIWGSLPEPDTFLHNNGNLTFTDTSRVAGLNGTKRGRNVSLADFDRDGYVDLFVGNLYEQPYLYRNQSGDRRSALSWLVVTVEGTTSNRDGIGTRLTLELGQERMMREISTGPGHGGGDERAAFFGLGGKTSGHLRLRWPSGIEQNYGLVDGNQRLHIVEPAPLTGEALERQSLQAHPR